MLSFAWLLENRRLTPEKEKDGLFDDPHRSQFLVRWTNRMVVAMLGGAGQFFSGDAPPSVSHKSIWDDRVLRRAFEIAGGVPELEIGDASGALPAPLMKQLHEAVARPRA